MDRKSTNLELGKQIQAARIRAGLTQERFAELVDMNPKSVSAIERGVVGASLTNLKRICQVLSVSSDTLLFGPAGQNDVRDLTARLERLSPEQFGIARDILNKLMEAFALHEA